MSKQDELIDILIQQNRITEEQKKEILKEVEQGGKLDDIILKKRVVSEERLAKFKSKVYNLPYIDITDKKITEAILTIIPNEVAENYKIICFDRVDNKISVGIIDPGNFKAMEAIDFLAKGKKLQAEYFQISRKSFLNAFNQYRSLDQELSYALETRAQEEEELHTVSEKDSMELEEVTKSAPVAKIVSVIIRHAVEGRASDIHIEPIFKESRVRYRIDGVLHTSLVLPRSVHASIIARIKVMANLKLDETRVPQDGRIRMEINEKVIDFRVSTLPLMGDEKIVMRILDTTRGAPKLEELGFQGEQLKAIHEAMEKTEGIILVTGPTGSGKSTTIFSILDVLNKETVNIATLEDPVEYQMKGVNQSQIKPEIGYTFAAGLRSFLRQDPDIIMVGEVRDHETAELSIHAALTGHLVLSTLHTTDAPGSITRLVDMDVEAFLLGSTLVAAVAQRLARKICEKCKEETKIPDEYIKEIKTEIPRIGKDYINELIPNFDENNLKFFKGKGCPQCGNSGYSGRLSICEVLSINDELKEMILSGKKHLTLEEIKHSQHFVTVKQDGLLKAIQGMTTVEEVLRVMRD